MKVCCISDLHGHTLPVDEIPECDLLLMAGDMEGYNHPKDQAAWIEKVFAPWVQELSKRCQVVGIAGNHSWIYYHKECLPLFRVDKIPEVNWVYLEDNSFSFKGLNIYGSPWSNPFFDWAFMMREEVQEYHLKNIPEDTHILISHTPPFGYGDPGFEYGPEGVVNTLSVGSKALLRRINELPNLKLVVCGHLHSGTGIYKIVVPGELKDGFHNPHEVLIVNAALLDENYNVTKKPILVEI